VDPDLGSGAFLTPGSRSGMNNTDHISERLETIFGFKKLKFFDADLGSRIEKKFGSGKRAAFLSPA
jgi:hypothetical protein